MMNEMMIWMGLGWLFGIVILVLLLAALVKYLFFDHRKDR